MSFHNPRKDVLKPEQKNYKKNFTSLVIFFLPMATSKQSLPFIFAAQIDIHGYRYIHSFFLSTS